MAYDRRVNLWRLGVSSVVDHENQISERLMSIEKRG
jgi:hypothetical protein